MRALIGLLLLASMYAATLSYLDVGQAEPVRTLFEGGRLIAGDGRAPIDSAEILVENESIVRVGRKGQIKPPAGTTRIDLTGQTVIPGLVSAHGHVGYQRGVSFSAESAIGSRSAAA